MKKISTTSVVTPLIALLTSVLSSNTLSAPFPEAGDLQRGAKTWAENCGRCHNIRSPQDMRNDQWITSVFHMRVRAGLTGQETRDVLTFLQNSNSLASGNASTSVSSTPKQVEPVAVKPSVVAPAPVIARVQKNTVTTNKASVPRAQKKTVQPPKRALPKATPKKQATVPVKSKKVVTQAPTPKLKPVKLATKKSVPKKTRMKEAETKVVTATPKTSTKSITTGKAIYQQTCIACHGSDGTGMLPGVPDLTMKSGRLSKSDSTLIKNITQGFQSPGSPMAMPAKGGNPKLSDADIKAVLSYLRKTYAQ